MVADERGLELVVLREDLQEAIFSRHHLIIAKKKIAKRNKSLRCDVYARVCSCRQCWASKCRGL
jgi:hypothetical protein